MTDTRPPVKPVFVPEPQKPSSTQAITQKPIYMSYQPERVFVKAYRGYTPTVFECELSPLSGGFEYVRLGGETIQAKDRELERLRAALKAAEDKQCASCRRIHELIASHQLERELRDFQTIIELRCALKAHEVQWNRLQDAITGMEKTMEAHGIDYFKWRPMTFDETLKRDAP